MSKDEKKDKGGRPPFYDCPEELQDMITEYFEKGLKIRTVLVGRVPNQTTVEIPIPTITGLAYYLGFESRQSFYAYENKDEFSYFVKNL